ncbi:MAG: nuclear transport factor 2 family protein [Gammaproteobacteria bacterium]|nr:nuclear transport factor 2 family protein [Gammaproteobacteria bacterium]
MSNETLESRLQRFEDERALEKLINTYHKRADAFDWGRWAETFTEDAVFEFAGGFGVMRGRQDIHDKCKGSMDHVYNVMQHIMVNLDFEVAGSRATGTGNLIFVGISDPQKPTEFYMSGGRYRWVFARTKDGWKIAEAFLEFIWTNGADAEAVFVPDDKKDAA